MEKKTKKNFFSSLLKSNFNKKDKKSKKREELKIKTKFN